MLFISLKDDLFDDGITLSEGRQEEDEHINEVEINQSKYEYDWLKVPW